MKKVSILFILLLGLSLAGAACGAGGPSKSIRVTINDFAFSPNTFTVPAGEQISFTASNNGAVQHDFIIMNLGHDVQGQFKEEDKANVYWKKEFIEPGGSVTDTFTAPGEPGEYQVICGIAGHFQAGMIGKLVVVAPSP
jgi:uncharacterized cupredoxin-like copper-binding protein